MRGKMPSRTMPLYEIEDVIDLVGACNKPLPKANIKVFSGEEGLFKIEVGDAEEMPFQAKRGVQTEEVSCEVC
ncbi:hypothetical protein VNO78_27358 [Psophocarpus tetragonolobus]|uniref:Uncharacterized protein n=1 Tax=Psophocarpus tetragonolobus TaxID=3891 RepID=A0AAN9XAH1_PSOTE